MMDDYAMSEHAPQLPQPLSSFDRQLVASFRRDRLQLILLPTEECNFRCTYCYEDFAIGQMAPGIVEGVKNLIDRRAGELTSLRVSWFGGEPMLARSVIEDVAGHARVAAQRHSGLRYEGDMTTNGYMLDAAAAEQLAALGIRAYQVSLDGPAGYHDRTRVRRDGRGSFERIWRNLLSIRASAAPVNIMLRIHLTPANLPVMAEFLTEVRNCLLDDPRFTVFLKKVVRLGGPNDAGIDVLSPEYDAQIADLQALVLEGGEDNRLFEPEDTCYAARANSLLVRADGRLGKCTVALNDEANTIGELLPDGSLRIDNPRFRAWLQGWESHDQELIGCPAAAFTDEQPLMQIMTRPPRTALSPG